MADITVTVKDIGTNTSAKINEAIEVLCKAGKLPLKTDTEHHEESPYRAIRELEERCRAEVQERLSQFYDMFIGKTVMKATGFKIGGKVYLNPKTGKPMTKVQWKEITDTLERGFNWCYGSSQEKITALAAALGLIIRTMADKESAKDLGLDAIGTEEQIAEQASDEILANTLAFAQAHTAEYIVDLTAQSRKKIALVILDAYQNRWSAEELERELFEEFGDLNRDWQRVAVTEIARNFTSGFIATELSMPTIDGYHWVVGISSPNACDFCLDEIKDVVFVLLDGPPSGGSDEITINGEQVPCMWPGKTNAGLSKGQWWACIPAHPSCRCNLTPWEPGLEDLEAQVQAEAERLGP